MNTCINICKYIFIYIQTYTWVKRGRSSTDSCCLLLCKTNAIDEEWKNLTSYFILHTNFFVC